MSSVLAGISIPQLMLIVNVLGLPGLFVVFWFVMTQNQAKLIEKMDDHREEEKDRVAAILKEYKDDVAKVSTFYERNVELVDNYEKLANSLANIIHLNTQVQTQLVESIKNNMFCPIVRKQGPEGK